MVYCGPLVFFIIRNSVWVDEGKPRKFCGHAGAALDLRIKGDTVCVWQNSIMFTEMLSGTGVISVSTKAGGCIAMRMTLHAEPQDREEFVHLLLF